MNYEYNPVELTSDEHRWLQELIETGKVHNFYIWGKWIKQRDYVWRQDRFECQLCKAAGRYKRARTVHHVRHLKKHPGLALKMWVYEDGEWRRQLISLCKECHEREHPERLNRKWKPPLTKERWD